MHRMLRTAILITFGLLILGIITGCADDDPTGYGEINLVATVPEEGATISATEEFRIVFDGFPASVTVDGKAATILDNTATVQGADLINAGTGAKKTFIISWTNLDNSFVRTKTVTFDILKSPITVEVDPPPGPVIDHDFTEFTFRFSQEVVAVTVNGTAATGAGRNWSLRALHLPLGGQSLNIEWKNRDGSTGSKVAGYYTLQHFQYEPPSITSSTVSDGAADVDPALINAGGLRFDFDERITGTIKLTDEAGADLD